MRISACVITKNEENNLPAWLDCMSNIVDEMIVVDTGSTDKTVEIARAAGAKVSFFRWRDDFAAAKNFALDQATGDWVLFLDADEYFLAGDCPKVREFVRTFRENPEILGLVFLRVNIDQSTGKDLGSSSYVIRCFQRTPSLRYFGRIHEELRNASETTGNVMQYVPGVVIYHTGYTPRLMEGKLRQTIAILEKSQAEDGVRAVDDVYFLDCYYGLGDYEKAISHARRAIAQDVALLGLANRPTSLLILSLMKAKHPPEEIRAELQRAVERFPTVAEYWMFWGAFDWENQDYEAAERHFARGVEMCRTSGEASPGVSVTTDHAAELLPYACHCLDHIARWKAGGQDPAFLKKVIFPF